MRRPLLSLILATVLGLAAAPSAFAAGTMAKVLAIVNGNTLKVNMRGQELVVRLSGVASPDPNDERRPLLKQLGTEAVAFLREYLKDGWVYLEFPTGQPAQEKDGAVPAFAYHSGDAALVNEQMIKTGFAIANRKEMTALRDRFITTEDQAKSAQAGVWGSFEAGGGQKVAAGGVHQWTYIGEPGRRSGGSIYYMSNDYVRVWVNSYY